MVFALGAQGPWIYLGATLIGLGIGAETDLLTYTMSRYFPVAALGRALGAVWIFWAWGNATGVALGSLSFDLTGNYDLAMILYVILALISSVLIMRLGSYAYPPHAPSTDAPLSSGGGAATVRTRT